MYKKLILSTLLWTSSTSLFAEPTNMVVGFPPGGGQYIVSQLISNSVPVQLVVTPGAQGVIAMNSCIVSQNSLCITTQAQLLYAPRDPELNKAIKYSKDNIKRLLGIGRSPTVLVAAANREIDIKNIKSTAVFGAGTAGLKQDTQQITNKLNLKESVIVNYKGVGPTIIDLLGGHIDYALVPWTTVSMHVKSNKLKIVAVTETTDPLLQNVPSFGSTLNLSIGDTVFALIEPTTASRATTDMYDSIAKLVSTPDFKQGLEKLEIEPLPNGFNVLKHYSSQLNSGN